jgi:hypothetical protein
LWVLKAFSWREISVPLLGTASLCSKHLASNQPARASQKILQSPALGESHEQVQVVARISHAVKLHAMAASLFEEHVADHALVPKERMRALCKVGPEDHMQRLFRGEGP